MISGKYKIFYDKLATLIPKERMLHDALSTLAFGTDASFYRLIPKLVVRANDEKEIQFIMETAWEMDIPVTFRAAGTSLSGQAISDSVLVIATHGFKGYEILDNGLKIKLDYPFKIRLIYLYICFKKGTACGCRRSLRYRLLQFLPSCIECHI